MSHEFESGFFVHTPAWHRLGVVLKDAPSDPREAQRLAGLDWKVFKRNVFVRDPMLEEDYVEHPDYHHLVRSDSGASLAIVKKTYQPYQNDRLFDWFKPFVESGVGTFEAAGSLKEGRRVWALLKLSIASAEVADGDPVSMYLLVSNAHDGTAAWSPLFTNIRVVCWNTLSAAMTEAEGRKAVVKVKHTKNIDDATIAVRDTIDIARRTFSVTVEQYRAMNQMSMGITGLERYVREVFGLRPLDDLPRAWQQIRQNFFYGVGADKAGETVWGGYNALTEFFSHQRGRTDATRLDSSWFGASKKDTARAHNVAVAMATP
jgi:phage/plasmid-like protein (TIGR03299 family)